MYQATEKIILRLGMLNVGKIGMVAAAISLVRRSRRADKSTRCLVSNNQNV